jgi:hypothetical protein
MYPPHFWVIRPCLSFCGQYHVPHPGKELAEAPTSVLLSPSFAGFAMNWVTAPWVLVFFAHDRDRGGAPDQRSQNTSQERDPKIIWSYDLAGLVLSHLAVSGRRGRRVSCP